MGGWCAVRLHKGDGLTDDEAEFVKAMRRKNYSWSYIATRLGYLDERDLRRDYRAWTRGKNDG